MLYGTSFRCSLPCSDSVWSSLPHTVLATTIPRLLLDHPSKAPCCILPSTWCSPSPAILLQITRFPSLIPHRVEYDTPFICRLNLQFIPYNSHRIWLQWVGGATYECLLLNMNWVVGLIARRNSISIPNLKLWWGASVLFSLVAVWI